MRHARTHADASEEWVCPTCGRRLLVDRADDYRTQVLEVGDEGSGHVGGSAAMWRGYQPVPATVEGRSFSSTSAPLFDTTPAPFDAADRADELLRPWLSWLERSPLA